MSSVSFHFSCHTKDISTDQKSIDPTIKTARVHFHSKYLLAEHPGNSQVKTLQTASVKGNPSYAE